MASAIVGHGSASLPVGGNLNLELHGRNRQALGFGILDIFAGLPCSQQSDIVPQELKPTHITVVLDTKVEA